MIIVSEFGTPMFPLKKPESREKELEQEIRTKSIRLDHEKNYGLKRVLDNIEELQNEINENRLELEQIKKDQKSENKLMRTKPNKWNWR